MAALVALGLAAGGTLRADWTEQVTLSGDTRVRFQRTDEDGQEARDRIRFQARVGLAGKVNDTLAVGLRFSSGEEDDPISDNQTMGDASDKKSFSIIRAYLDWTPVDGLHLIAGKMAQPWIAVNDLVFAGGLNPEGVAATYTRTFDGFDLMANASYMVVEENKEDDEVTLSHGQVAAKLRPDLPITLLAGASLYAWENTDLWLEDATEYRTVEGFVELARTTGFPVTVHAQVAVNTEADTDDTGYLVGVKLGRARAPGSFEVGYQYRRLEKYCTVEPFAENSDTGDGTDVAAHIPYIRYVISKNFDLKAQVALVERGLDDGHDLNTFKLDFSAKF